MAQELRVDIAHVGDQSAVPSTHSQWLTTPCNSDSRGYGALFWILQAPALTYQRPHHHHHHHAYVF